MSELEKYSEEQIVIAEQFSLLRLNCDLAAKRLMAVKITDSTTMTMADQALSLASEELKKVEEIHKHFKAPLLKLTRQIDGAKKELSEPLEKGIAFAKAEKIKWVQLEAKRKEEELKILKEKHEAEMRAKEMEEARKNALMQKIIDYQNEAITAINNCTDGAELTVIATKYLGAYPKDEFSEFQKMSVECHSSILTAGQQRRKFITENDLLKASNDANAKAQAEINAQQEALKVAQQESERLAKIRAEQEEALLHARVNKAMELAKEALEEHELLKNEIKGVVKKFKAEVVDFDKVPDVFKVIDEKKIAQYISDNKDILVDGEIKMGLKFYLETSVRIQ